MWLAHRSAYHAVLLGSIPARRLHPLGKEVELAAAGVHPGHPPTLARRTHCRRLVRRWRHLDVRRHRWCGAHRRLEQLSAPLELRLAAPSRAQPIRAETLEAGGQDMAQEPPDACDGIEGHEPLTVAMGIIFPPKAHPPVLQREPATIRDRHARRIAREILQDLSRTTGGWLGLHHPLCALEGAQELLPPLWMGARVALPLQHQGPFHVHLTEPGQEQTTEDATQHPYWEEERRPTSAPLRPIG
jgi:hypothetical protein